MKMPPDPGEAVSASAIHFYKTVRTAKRCKARVNTYGQILLARNASRDLSASHSNLELLIRGGSEEVGTSGKEED